MTYRVGVDIGGTFTDLTAVREDSGERINLKALTTTGEPERGVIQILRRVGFDLGEVDLLVHGTTIAINALVERKGAKTGLITTRGFRDVLELRRCARTHLGDPFMQKPWIFIPRELRVEVNERVLANGEVLDPLDEESGRTAIKRLAQEGVESIAICLLNSYANPAHEQRLQEILQTEFPHLYYSLSVDIVPEIREYERTSTTSLNAYIQPVVHRYLSSLAAHVKDNGGTDDLHVMQSNGGIMTWQEAGRKPIHIIESGPTAGAIAAAYLGGLIGVDNIVSFDMGGTTSKACVIEGGVPETTREFEIFEESDKPGSGWPIRIPMIELVEVGAGGGSIAWLDPGGSLKVGPESAGAVPGPVSYGGGGELPTITDANVALGRLETLLGGELTLNVSKAREAIRAKIADPMGLSIDEAAQGIIQIADTRTADLIREVTVAKGRDPRDFGLVAFGGAGPLHAAAIIEELGIPQVIVPIVAGNFSAYGLVATDLFHDQLRTYITSTMEADLEIVNQTYRELERDLLSILAREGVADSDIVIDRSADMRYVGQFHEVNVPVPQCEITQEILGEMEAAFHQKHLDLFTYMSEEEPTEVLNIRVRVTGKVRRPRMAEIAPGEVSKALRKPRQVYFHAKGGYVESQVYGRELLGQGCVIKGPAIIEELTATTLVPPDFEARVDSLGNLIIIRVT